MKNDGYLGTLIVVVNKAFREISIQWQGAVNGNTRSLQKISYKAEIT